MDIKKAYKFCPRCGARTEKKDTKSMHCTVCGLDTYFSPKPVQEVVLRNMDGKYLFSVRGVEPCKGCLDFPGGFVEPGETFEESARRELKEELGLDIQELTYLRTSFDQYLFQNINYRVVGVSFLANLPDNSLVKPADDVESVEFYSLDEVPTDRIAWPAMHELLKILRSIS